MKGWEASKPSKGEDDERFNQHFQARQECSMQITIEMRSHGVQSLLNAITRSVTFCNHLSQSICHVGTMGTMKEQCTLTRFLGQCTLGNGHTR